MNPGAAGLEARMLPLCYAAPYKWNFWLIERIVLIFLQLIFLSKKEIFHFLASNLETCFTAALSRLKVQIELLYWGSHSFDVPISLPLIRTINIQFLFVLEVIAKKSDAEQIASEELLFFLGSQRTCQCWKNWLNFNPGVEHYRARIGLGWGTAWALQVVLACVWILMQLIGDCTGSVPSLRGGC